MNAIRIATKSRDVFNHAGMSLNRGWKPIDMRDIGPEQLAVLDKYVGDELLVHPTDAPKLAQFGRALERGRVVRRANMAAPQSATTEAPEVATEADTQPTRKAARR